MVCDCSSYEDIEEFGEEILYDGIMPEDLYLWLDSYAYTSGDVEVSKRVDVSVAIFSVDSFNPPTMSYTLTTNLPKGDRIDDGGSGLLIFIIIVAVVIGIIVYKKRSNSSKNATNTSYANTSTYPTQQTQYNQSSQQSKSSQVGAFCPNCGSKVSTTFCTECGTKVN